MYEYYDGLLHLSTHTHTHLHLCAQNILMVAVVGTSVLKEWIHWILTIAGWTFFLEKLSKNIEYFILKNAFIKIQCP